MNRQHRGILILLWAYILIIFHGCTDPGSGSGSRQTTAETPQAQVALLPDVDTSVVKVRTFEERWISAGVLEPSKKVTFQLADPLAPVEFRVRNGQRVSKGDTLVVQPQSKRLLALEKATLDLAESRAAYLDRLMALGYMAQDSLAIPIAIRNQAAMSSGWLKAKVLHKEALLELAQATIIAPFTGVVAGINLPNTEKEPAFSLSLVDLSTMLVTFQLLSKEVLFVKVGTPLRVKVAGIEKPFAASVEEINPEVSDAGLVYVRARLSPGSEKLLPGMAAEVIGFRSVPKQVVVPSTALLSRQGRDLVFVWRNDSAFWRYVTPGLRNDAWAIIEEGVEPGDIVISEGGFALANAVPVSIQQQGESQP